MQEKDKKISFLWIFLVPIIQMTRESYGSSGNVHFEV
jgi:hypothetical protein